MDFPRIYGVIFLLSLLHKTTAQELEFHIVNGDITSISELDIPNTVESVVLTANKITKLENGDFQDLGQCTSLHLGANDIHTIANRAFRGLNELLYLYLHFNQLTELPNLTDLPKLRELIIHSNLFADVFHTPVPVLPDNQIELLDMGHMDITFLTNHFLEKFPNLVELKIHDNDISSAPAIDVISDHLEILDMSSNPIYELETSSFKSDKSSVLRVFKFGPANSVSSVYMDPDFFRELSNLEEIYIQRWGLTELPDLSANIGTLETLTIHDNEDLDEIDPKMLFGDPPDYSQYVAMKHLNLQNNGLTYISGEVLAAMTNLRTLDLTGNSLATFPMEQLQGLSKLDSVILEDNELSTVCDIGHRDQDRLRIEIGGNPLFCNTKLCWLFDSGYIYYDEERLGTHFSVNPCAQPSNMASVRWEDISGFDIGCGGSSEPYGCSTPEPVTPDPGTNPNGNSDPQASPNDDESDLPLVPIAAGAVGGLILVLAIVIGVMIYRRRSNKSTEDTERPQQHRPRPPTATDNTYTDPNAIYISPDEKGSKKRHTYENMQHDYVDDHTYTEIPGRDSKMMRELGDINEIGLQAAFHSNGKASK